MNFLLHSPTILICVLLLSCISRSAAAEDRIIEQEARSAFQQGVQYHEAGRLSEAYKSFKRAHALMPSYKILFNIAQTEAELGHSLLAIESFEQYLAEGGPKIQDQRKRAVEKEIIRLRTIVHASLAKSVTNSQKVEEKTEQEPDFFWKSVAPWILTGLATTGLSSAIACGAKTSSLNESLDNDCTGGICPSDRQSDIDSLPAWAGATDGLIIGSVVLGIVATILFIAPWQEKPDKKHHRMSAAK